MEKSSIILLVLTVVAALGVFNLAPESSTQNLEEIYQYKIEFNNFKHAHGRRYDVQEEAFRFKIFKDNVNKIKKHNAD